VDNNFFQVFSEVWIEDWRLARFFFVRFCQRDALRDATAHRLGGMKDRNGPLAIFDDDLRARTRPVGEVFAIGLKRRNKVGGADGIRIYQRYGNKGVLRCSLAF
jgi:hypothetical protein